MPTNPTHILIAPDKFKGSLSALQVCEAIAGGIKKVLPKTTFDFAPLADGGDGSVRILAEALKLEERRLHVQDPLGRPVMASYYFSGTDAYVEMAAASGLVLLEPDKRNPLLTSTYGTGQLMRHAIDHGARRGFLFLGGSATNDGGMGLAEALGFQFLTADGQTLSAKGEALGAVAKITGSKETLLGEVEIRCMCDVLNPLLGKNGATYVYGPQKGADAQALQQLESGMENYAHQLAQYAGKPVHEVPGGGAAGGISAGLMALCDASINSGIEAIQQWIQLEERIQQADLIISGEGKIDEQTLEGKVVAGVLELAQKYSKPTVLMVGKDDLVDWPVQLPQPQAIMAVMERAQNEADAMQNAAAYLNELATEYFDSKRTPHR